MPAPALNHALVPYHLYQALIMTRAAALPLLLTLAASVLFARVAASAPQIADGAYRVDWNCKVRDPCVDVFTDEDLTDRGIGHSLRQL